MASFLPAVRDKAIGRDDCRPQCDLRIPRSDRPMNRRGDRLKQTAPRPRSVDAGPARGSAAGAAARGAAATCGLQIRININIYYYFNIYIIYYCIISYPRARGAPGAKRKWAAAMGWMGMSDRGVEMGEKQISAVRFCLPQGTPRLRPIHGNKFKKNF